ncbi:hypothetical protein Pst134EA_020979 [Puccinia striiformis f. sp. tritici]|uniref:Uncharacterized protein n=1 Tax=Puccinia striiformis f. sp. tritici PST-78 TaxID=1165861 RepID=A0A0L0W5B8_9BASI|nr:hypothetical protein Pst134EA_020979 [Puccinia striiformis f. sp. tritici]KAH9447756.1 hypothetical protein Pst134EB_021758 [Puccinia striiformis f. sp. tritici]KAH9457081.1 hypothetical protein Pst134EA_020979 [Puccinia striiformis f. sp. tritici]KNF06708.1 hypothetical protein PSTG_00024 [Puccinia striiformis f. sp. tritici PST-78]
MSATTMTQTTIKTQSVTSYHHHQPLLAASPCIIQSPTTEHQRRSTPLRCSARLISQSSSSSSILPTLPSPSSISTRRKRRRASTKNTTSSCSNSNTNLLRLSIGNPAPSVLTSSTVIGDPDTSLTSHAVPADRRPKPLTHPAPGSPARDTKNTFPSLKPLQAVSPIADKLSLQPCSSFTFFFQPHHPQPPLLSFPRTPIPSSSIFHFSPSTPARHLPPPHPGPRPFISLPSHPQSQQDSHHHHHHRLASHPTLSYRPQPFATWSATSQPYRTKSKRRTALPPAHYVRSKKIKIHHSFFRSPQVLYPVDYSLNTHASSRNSSSSSSALSRSRTIQNPKWLHTSTAAEGQPSRMGPPEAHYTGTPSPLSYRKPTFTLRSPSQLNPLPKVVPASKSHRPSQNASSSGPQVAPLKAQLLAVLRSRSSLQPGEAALRLKKWVIWNSWVRGRAQMRFYPIAQQIPSNQRISPITPSQAINSSEGNEMFDENGDLICEEDDEEEEEEEPRKQVEDKTQSCSSPPVQQRPSTPKPNRIPVHKSHTIIKLKIPPRTSSIQQYPPPPSTPPASPVSQNSSEQIKSDTDPLDPLNNTDNDRRPLTPPPSPPNK